MPLSHAFDEIRFGAGRTLDLRAQLPTRAQAVARAEAWLRQKQAEGAGEVLIITGRGNQSEGGVSVVREGVQRLLAQLRRGGVVKEMASHTPGSFEVKLAPFAALRDAPRRRGSPPPARASDPESLAVLSAETRELLRKVSLRAIEELGIRDPEPFLQSEMLEQLSCVVRSLPDSPDREERMRAALVMLLAEYDER